MIKICKSLEELDKGKLKALIEDSFGKKLCRGYFDGLTMSYTVLDVVDGNYLGAAVVEHVDGFDYLDKLAVSKEHQGNHTGGALLAEVQKMSPHVCWRAKTSNKHAIGFYSKQEGLLKHDGDGWIVYCSGIGDGLVQSAVDYALSKPETLLPSLEGKTIVISADRKALAKKYISGIAHGIEKADCAGAKVVVVHGSGHLIESANAINAKLVESIKKYGAEVKGLSGTESIRYIDDEYILELKKYMDGHIVPVVSPLLSADNEGNIHFMNPDITAGLIAPAIGANKLVSITNVPGILRVPNDKDSLISNLGVDEAEALIAEGIITGCMKQKVNLCVYAAKHGVVSVIIDKNSLTKELFADEGSVGTLIED